MGLDDLVGVELDLGSGPRHVEDVVAFGQQDAVL
jgi:hypothetical protein